MVFIACGIFGFSLNQIGIILSNMEKKDEVLR